MASMNQILGGSWQDTQGNNLANGFLLFELNQDGIVNKNTLVCAGYEIFVPLNNLGNVVASPVYSLWPNSVMTPDTTFYTLSAYSESGQLVWGPNPVQIPTSPSPFDLGTLIPGDINT